MFCVKALPVDVSLSKTPLLKLPNSTSAWCLMIFQHSTMLNAKIITCLASRLFGGGKREGELEAAKHA